MTVSVCMGLYNGARYIEEQLYSILHQTRQPDEVILCDDVSTDTTVEIVDKFIRDNHLEANWKLFRNKENKGYPANFYYCMSLATGDIVYLADQDDIWHKEKIERICRVFEEKEDAKAVCCKFGLIDAQGGDIHTIMAPTRSKESNQLRSVKMEDIFYKNEYPGMVIAYRNNWGRKWLPENSKIPHDFLVCIRAAEEHSFIQLDMELAYHRRHDSNAGGEEHRVRRLLQKERKIKEIEDYLTMLRFFITDEIMFTEQGKMVVQEKYISMLDRYDALQSGKMSKVISNAWKYKGKIRLATVVCDLVIVNR